VRRWRTSGALIRLTSQILTQQRFRVFAIADNARKSIISHSMLLVISILLEASIAVIAVLAARQGRPYLYGLAFTFIAYVIYDLARFMQWPVEGPLLSGLFLLASVAALVAVWGLYRNPPVK
jgi:hypothetical protein